MQGNACRYKIFSKPSVSLATHTVQKCTLITLAFYVSEMTFIQIMTGIQSFEHYLLI